MELMQSTEIDQLTKALVEADKEFAPIKKDAKNPFFKSKYSTLTEIAAEATPILSKHGLKFRCLPDNEMIVGKISHISGQWEAARIKIRNAKGDMQGEGSAITYARRYLMCAMLNLVSDEDDDGNRASAKPVNQPKPQQTNKPRQPSGQNKQTNDPMTKAQAALIERLVREGKVQDGPDLDNLSALQASKVIEEGIKTKEGTYN